jgi:hypothetical protein
MSREDGDTVSFQTKDRSAPDRECPGQVVSDISRELYGRGRIDPGHVGAGQRRRTAQESATPEARRR